MVYGVYAIRDFNTGFSAPTVEQNDASAMRNFANACLVDSSLLHNFPDDFQLWKVAEFDSENGHFITVNSENGLPIEEPICKASDFVKRKVEKVDA